MKERNIDPKSKLPVIDQFNQGMTFMYSQEYSLAEQKFRALLETDPENSLAFRFLGDALSAESKYEAAVKAYSDSIRILPEAENTVKLAKAYNRLNQTKEAETILKQAMKDYPDYDDAIFELVSLYEASQQWSMAEELLYKDLPEFANQKGILYLRKNEPLKAVPEFQKAIQLQPRATYWNNLGIGYQQLNQVSEAEKAYREGLLLYPDYPELQANLAFLLVQTQQWDDATKYLKKVIGTNPQFWSARLALGFVLETQNKKLEAKAIYEKLLLEAPKDWPQRSKVEARLKQL